MLSEIEYIYYKARSVHMLFVNLIIQYVRSIDEVFISLFKS